MIKSSDDVLDVMMRLDNDQRKSANNHYFLNNAYARISFLIKSRGHFFVTKTCGFWQDNVGI